MTATTYDGERGPMLGHVSYPSGAGMIGLFGPDIGLYTASPESLLSDFSGWVYGATSSNPQPMDGIFSFRNGYSFTGQENGGIGIYATADGERRFVGKIDFEHGSFRPLVGILEDRRGRLLATVRPTNR